MSSDNSEHKLDNMTVRRFARLLKNDNPTTSSPFTTGTVVQDGNTLYVSSAGSLIPISQQNTSVAVGDEVTVAYGDDEAYIIGNNSDPSTTTTELTEAQKKIQRVKKEAQQAQSDAQTASEKADNLQLELDASNAKITDLSTEVGTVGTKVENAIKKADESLTTATEAKQTATELTGKVTRAYENAEEALSQSSTATQKANSIETTLKTDYCKKGEDTTYASQSDLKQTSDAIETTLSTEYTKTGKDTTYTKQSTFEQTVDGLEATISSDFEDAKKVATNYLSYTSSGLVVGNMTASTLGGNTQITSSGVNVRNGTTTLGSFNGTAITLGQTTTGNNNTYITTNGISMRNGTTTLASFTSSKATIGKTASGNNNVIVDTNGMSVNNGSTTLASFTSSKATIGKTASGNNNVIVDTNGMSVNNGSTTLASFTSDKITMGLTSKVNAKVDSSTFKVCNGDTDCIAMGYITEGNNTNAKIATQNYYPLTLEVAGWQGITGRVSTTRKGVLSDWITTTGSTGGWSIRRYTDDTTFYAELLYSGSSGGGSLVSVTYPSSYKLTTNKPHHASVSTQQSGTITSYAGYIHPTTTQVEFYPCNTVGTTGTTPFTVFVAGYFTI